MSTINRRTFIKGTGAGSLFVLTLAGCSPKEEKPTSKASADSSSEPVQKRPQYVMVFDQNKCVGCGECKEACNETNKLPAGFHRLTLERQNGRTKGEACPYCGKIEPCDCERKYVRVSCQQCLDAPCVRVCPTQAAHRDPKTNIVTMDPDRCVGCKYCIAACPYNVRFINPADQNRGKLRFLSAYQTGQRRRPGLRLQVPLRRARLRRPQRSEVLCQQTA